MTTTTALQRSSPTLRKPAALDTRDPVKNVFNLITWQDMIAYSRPLLYEIGNRK